MNARLELTNVTKMPLVTINRGHIYADVKVRVSDYFCRSVKFYDTLVTSLLVDIWETDFSVKMLMNASLVVFINVTMMQIVLIMMVHMTVNVKLVFMVMDISIVFMTNYAKSKNVMKMPIVNHLKAWFTGRDISRSIVDRWPG